MDTLKRIWQQISFFKWAVLGIALGVIAVEVLARFGVAVTLEEGILWGAVAGLVVTYIPYFLRSGKRITKRDNRVLNFFVGVLVFLAISAVVVVIFLGILYVLSFFIR